MGAGLRPDAKATEPPPDPTVRYWLVSAYGNPEVYRADAPCVLTVRTPPEAAAGMRIDWARFRREAATSSIRARAYLSLMALLDRSARNGEPITRQIRAPVSPVDGGRTVRASGGRLVRDGELVDNPAARYAPLLRESDVAAFVGMDSTRKSRFDARAAIGAFASEPDPVVELIPDRGGWRVYGTREDWHEPARRLDPWLDERIAALERLRDKLSSCIGCGCLSLDKCSLDNPDDTDGRLGTGPRYLPGDSSGDPRLRG